MGREGIGRRGRRGGGCLRNCENETRVGEIRTLRVGRRPRMREEVNFLAKICSSTSRLEHCLDELWGRTNAVTKL